MLVHLRATDTLHESVVLNPQWLLDKLSRVIADEIHVKQMRYDRHLRDAAMSKDFTVLRRRSLATLRLLAFLWTNEEVDHLLDFLRNTILLSSWIPPEKSLSKAIETRSFEICHGSSFFRRLFWLRTMTSVLVAYDDVIQARTSGIDAVMSVGTKVADFVPFSKMAPSLKEDEGDIVAVERIAVPLAPGLTYHLFLSHQQAEAGGACNLVVKEFMNCGHKV
ncbi:Hypothetical Protein FCC1311_057772 [Hondaea fermentalgiana]|uniref:Uncharacterized protein n=1 Tax=Hondaea fermentalgiana TaxID=2315210 RepID=A0A2R5GF51_9STRA|nr:Hypothetical Protein FCC1311_057772 [Hondaea fermentalgiana]|eukprot:GBG29556.1 Hypothetical Protein FCC1311_057772 [Hondaea fermentalgiana]